MLQSVSSRHAELGQCLGPSSRRDRSSAHHGARPGVLIPVFGAEESLVTTGDHGVGPSHLVIDDLS